MASSHFPTRTRKRKCSDAPSVVAPGVLSFPVADGRLKNLEVPSRPGKLLEMPNLDQRWEPITDEGEVSDERLIRDRLELIRGMLKTIEEQWICSIERRLDLMYPKKEAR